MTGITYVMTNPVFRSVKVGYTSPGSFRYEHLMRNGWQPYRHLHMESAELARRVEQATLFDIRFRLHIPVHLTSAHMGHLSGWTETSSADLISAREVWDLVCEQGAIEQLAPVVRPTSQRGVARNLGYRRQKGDTPRYAKVARIEAARTARAAQVGAPNQPNPKAKKATD